MDSLEHTENTISVLVGYFPEGLIMRVADLTESDRRIINTPGALTHSINPMHLGSQLDKFGRIKSLGEGNYLIAHLTDLDGKTLFLSEDYPGALCRTFGGGIVFNDRVQTRASLLEISNDDLMEILDSFRIYTSRSVFWQNHGISRRVSDDIGVRVDKLGFKYSPDRTLEKDLTHLAVILATAHNIRVATGSLESDWIPLVQIIGAKIAQVIGNRIQPYYPGKDEIQLVVVS